MNLFVFNAASHKRVILLNVVASKLLLSMNSGGTPGALKVFGAAEQMENWAELLDIISPCYHHRHWND